MSATARVSTGGVPMDSFMRYSPLAERISIGAISEKLCSFRRWKERRKAFISLCDGVEEATREGDSKKSLCMRSMVRPFAAIE